MHVLIHLAIISALILTLGTVAIFLIESPDEESEIRTMLDTLWWTATTVTTVGYGDVVPVTDLGRIVGIAYMFVGIAILGIVISVVGTSMIRSRIIHGAKDQTEENQISILKKIEELEKLEREDRKILDALQKDIHSSLQKDSKTIKEE